MKTTRRFSQGFGLIELLIGLTIIATVLVSMFQLSGRALQLRSLTVQDAQASQLTTEGVEALRLIRDSGWATTSALLLNTDYYLSWNGVMWQANLGTGPLVDGVFDRHFRLSSIYRDVNHRIVSSGGTLDPDSRLVTLYISWRPYYSSASTTKMTNFALFNLFN